jgi:hypothetical protein
MPYAILRIAKHSHGGAIAAIGKHNSRELEVPNADQARAVNNRLIVGSADLLADVERRINEAGVQPRNSTTVRAVEHILTTSPEWWQTANKEQKTQWYHRSTKWLLDRYGRENIVHLSLHQDETTPHLHAVTVPIVEGKLNAKAIYGDRSKMREMQTSYAQVLADLGLERGVEGSRAQHQPLRRYYGQVEAMTRLDSLKTAISMGVDLQAQAAAARHLGEQLAQEKRQTRGLAKERDRLKQERGQLVSDLGKVAANPKAQQVSAAVLASQLRNALGAADQDLTQKRKSQVEI